jgi:hypothetical protein
MRVYVVDVILPTGQRIAAYVEAPGYPQAVKLAQVRHPGSSVLV